MNKRKKPINTKPYILFAMALFMTTIVLFVIYAVAEDKKPVKNNTLTVTPEAEPTTFNYNKNERTILTVVREVDPELFVITLINAETGESDIYTYTGATDVLDKYGKVLSARQLKKGEMADVVYDEISKRIYKIQISSDTWEYRGMNNLLFNTEKRIISFLNERYMYNDGLLVLDNGAETKLTGFIKKDAFTIRGYGHKVCSITLTRGHGYLKLMDSESFIGGNIYIGSRVWEQIIENMIITISEGEYDVTVERGGYNGTERIKIPRNETVTLYIGGYGPEVQSVGRVYFSINPAGANLYIDNVLKSYAGPIELSYGMHKIEVSMGGYRTYTGNITVDKTENSFTVTLSQTPVGEEDNPYDIDNGDEYISQNPDLTPGPTRPDEGNRPSEGDTTSEMPVKIDDELTITIYCTNGTEVYFNGTYMGEVANGKLVVPKYIGTFEIDLYLEGYDIVPYTMEVEDDNENVEITLPGFY